ncbi:N-6 DNA methylase [Treponema sp.]|uniref:N-6 DNA methylase n=1 Tax=Treponema sp. TaxID=166 RepID=UPI00298EAFA5|nr:N-6 DNA methylase [Treponema sp.]MCQ2241560.1 N-6 DNA methylase [Treponema sp.]
MNYISVKEAAKKFSISERRIQKLCEANRIKDCTMVSGVWLIPESAEKPLDGRLSVSPSDECFLNLCEVCKTLSISVATGRNWIKLNKIKPAFYENKTPYFEREYVNSLSDDLKSGTNDSLKSRRNKKFISGNNLYNSYITEKCRNISLVQNLLNEIDSKSIELTEEIIGYFLADCAIHFVFSKNNIPHNSELSLFKEYITGNIAIREYTLIDEMILNKECALEFYYKHPSLFDFDYIYEKKEDVLGLIYISCKNIGNRKATGAYYTPTKVVNRLVSSLSINENTKILDPCCGTGNFLIQLSEKISFDSIYGIDVDSQSVRIARINMALRYGDISLDIIKSHICEMDFLTNFSISDFSLIIGNPPWGYDFSVDQKKVLKKLYKSALNTSIESYDVFIEKALNTLAVNGQIAFVLPEAILNVKSHSVIRQIIIDTSNIKRIEFLGNAFDGVQCPCIIIKLEKNKQTHSTIGMIINDGGRQFEIHTERKLNSAYLSFLTNDEEYQLLEKIKKTENCTTLLGNADFALGIVTGNNKDYVFNEKNNDNEIVLKGSDICKYKIKPSYNYIIFRPEKFQQVAPTELYRTEEKLFYRFICNQLVFAYDNKQTLSLNSCNIVIPKLPTLNIKYIMCILNSRIAQFLFKKEFNSIKVLRSHIESIPLPIITQQEQADFIKLVDLLIKSTDIALSESIYNELDQKICNLFKLDSSEQDIIKNVIDNGNEFLC